MQTRWALTEQCREACSGSGEARPDPGKRSGQQSGGGLAGRGGGSCWLREQQALTGFQARAVSGSGTLRQG